LMTGQDAELAACRNIVQGYQTMTIYKSVKTLAYKAAEIAIKISNNEKIADATGKVWNGQIDVPSILLEPVTVDNSSLKTTVIADGFHTETEIYSK
jgi:D-xylose transport system substrate-binding protein